jgi:antagonist of KipI
VSAKILRAGFLTTVQDLGRVGFREFGVSLGGALDSHALRVANLLVGNDESDAGLEITLGGLRIRFDDERTVAWCGGEFDVRVGSTSLPAGHATFVRAGEELIFNPPRLGCRSWLTISGGIGIPIVLGSRSTDLRGNFGGLDGRPLRDGELVPLGKILRSPAFVPLRRGRQTAATGERISSWSAPVDWTTTAKENPILRIVRGAEWDRFIASSHLALTSHPFVVSPDSDRMGARLDGPELKRNEDVDLVSEAVAPGTIQVPPSGKPIVLLGDCQTIGGYPKIAHVITVDLPIAAQLRAGDHVRFQEVSLAEAHRLLAERERNFNCFRTGLSLRTP